MNLDAKRGKEAAIDTGVALAGAIAAHAVTSFATEKLMASNSASTMGKYIPVAIVAGCIAVQALGIVPKGNDAIASALLGASITSGMSAVRELSGANDSTKNTTGLAKLVAQYVPFVGAPAIPGEALHGLYDYRESAALLAQAGGSQRMLEASNAWSAPAAPAAQLQQLRNVG